jgi:DNA repair photolyase
MIVEKAVAEPFTTEDPPDGSHLTIVDPYDGCTIGCPYCFQREDEGWSDPIVVKTNLPDLLRVAIERRPVDGDVYVGSRCDPYMPMEARYGLTRRCLEVLSDHRVRTFVCTKAGPETICRDLDVLRSFHGALTVVLGLTNLDQIIRAGDSARTANVGLARRLHDEGITVWGFVMPVLPGITDVRAILDALPPAIPLWLFDLKMGREDRAASGFMGFLESRYPHLVETYRGILDGAPRAYYEELRRELGGDERVRFPYG